MTSMTRVLEDFEASPAKSDVSAIGLDENDIEGIRLESFESGYQAGWDDAIKAQSDDHGRISSAFAQHLQDLSFTYHEACSHTMNAMAPLLQEIANSLLPEAARSTLGQHIADQLTAMAKQIGTLDVVVAVAPDMVESVAPLMDADFGFPVRLEPDNTLSDAQADIRFGETEQQIDLNALVASIREAMEGFTYENRRQFANG